MWYKDLNFHLSMKKKRKNNYFNSPHVYQTRCILLQGLGGGVAGAECFAPCLFLILPWQIICCKHWLPAHTANSNRSLRTAQERIWWTRVSDNHSTPEKRLSPLSHHTSVKSHGFVSSTLSGGSQYLLIAWFHFSAIRSHQCHLHSLSTSIGPYAVL